MSEKISIIVPVYNERESVHKVVDTICEMSDAQHVEPEIIVVDDGSSDGIDHDAVRERVDHLIIHPRNIGYGAAIKTGIRHATGDILVIIDADGTYPVDRIPDLVAALDRCAMAVGARTGDVVNIPLARQPAKYVLNRLANYLAERRIPDLNSGLRAFRKDDVEQFLHILPRGFSLTTTLTLAYISSDMLVEYIPINYFDRKGRSKIRPVSDTRNIILTILRTIVYFDPLKVCVPLSGILAGLSIIVLVLSALFMDRVMDGTVGVLAVTAVQVLVIGLLADLIVRRSS